MSNHRYLIKFRIFENVLTICVAHTKANTNTEGNRPRTTYNDTCMIYIYNIIRNQFIFYWLDLIRHRHLKLKLYSRLKASAENTIPKPMPAPTLIETKYNTLSHWLSYYVFTTIFSFSIHLVSDSRLKNDQYQF